MERKNVLQPIAWTVSGFAFGGAFMSILFGAPPWVERGLVWVGIAASLPFLLLDLRQRWRELSGYQTTLGPVLFWILLLGTVALILLLAEIKICWFG